MFLPLAIFAISGGLHPSDAIANIFLLWLHNFVRSPVFVSGVITHGLLKTCNNTKGRISNTFHKITKNISRIKITTTVTITFTFAKRMHRPGVNYFERIFTISKTNETCDVKLTRFGTIQCKLKSWTLCLLILIVFSFKLKFSLNLVIVV